MLNFNYDNMKKIIIILVLFLLASSIILALWILGSSDRGIAPTNPTSTNNLGVAAPAMIFSPLAESTINSPVSISGQARGWWFFEASFPIKIVDANDQLLGIVPAQAQADWMTADFVPFEAIVEFSQPSTSSGFIVLVKDNPSGLPENDDEIRLPIKFDFNTSSTTTLPQRTVKFYYYDASRDQDEQGNIQCSQAGLVAVDQLMPTSISPIKDTLKLFLSSPLAESAKATGLTSEFPLSGVLLDDLALRDGNLTIRLSDPENKTIGGSCRVSILREQLEAVAKQFPEVSSVSFEPAELFQP